MTQVDQPPHTHTRPGPDEWLAARLAADQPAETWARVPRLPEHIPADATTDDDRLYWPHEVSDTGHYRSIDRTLRDGRPCNGQILAAHPSNRPVCEHTPNSCDCPKYQKAKLRDRGITWSTTIHKMQLMAFRFNGQIPDGLISRHLDDNPTHNWWPENVTEGTPPENEADKLANRDSPQSPHVPSPSRLRSRIVMAWPAWLGGRRRSA